MKCFSTSFCIAAYLDPRRLEELDPHDLGVGRADADVDAGGEALRLERCRATAAGSTRRSATSTPVEASPEIIARLIIRHAAGASRLATTRAPRLSAVPSAAARRTAISGVRSTFTSPETPCLPKSRVVPRDSQMRLSKICEPVSTSLYG